MGGRGASDASDASSIADIGWEVRVDLQIGVSHCSDCRPQAAQGASDRYFHQPEDWFWTRGAFFDLISTGALPSGGRGELHFLGRWILPSLLAKPLSGGLWQVSTKLFSDNHTVVICDR